MADEAKKTSAPVGEPPTFASTSSSLAAALTSSLKMTKRNGNGHGNGKLTINNGGNSTIAQEFKLKLDSLLESKAPISKERMNQIVQEALKSAKYYKHVVYYVESFIKKCPREFKISGLYIIDAIIRNTKSSSADKSTKGANKKATSSAATRIKDVYNKRFAINMCKTFTNLFNKASKLEREKLNKVLKLWQKYKVFDVETMDKLLRISATSKIDSVINSANNSTENVEAGAAAAAINDSASRLKVNPNSSEKKKVRRVEDEDLRRIPRPTSPRNRSPVATAKEISKILDYDSDSDSDQEANSLMKRKQPAVPGNSRPSDSPQNKAASGDAQPLDASSFSQRYKNSINNCAAWLESSMEATNKSKITINLPDLTQPPPPILKSTSAAAASSPVPVPPPPGASSSLFRPSLQPNPASIFMELPKEKERERLKKGLPKIRPNHLCICSKTIWLGHLSKTTTEEMLISEISDLAALLLGDKKDKQSWKSSSKSAEQPTRKFIVDIHLIPPRGCAFIELIDRRTAAKCLDRMKDGYRIDASHIKVAWATNKGINQDRRIKQHWNVEVGCTYIPWSDLEACSKDSIEFVKWSEGGILDEDSLPPAYLELYKKHQLKASEEKSPAVAVLAAASTTAGSSHNQEDMDLDEQVDGEQSLVIPTSRPLTPPMPSMPPQPHPATLMVPSPAHVALAQAQLHQAKPMNEEFARGIDLTSAAGAAGVQNPALAFMPANSIQVGNFRLTNQPGVPASSFQLPMLNAAQHASIHQQLTMAAAAAAAARPAALNGAQQTPSPSFYAPLYHHSVSQFMRPPPPPPTAAAHHQASSFHFASAGHAQAELDKDKPPPNGFFLIVNKQPQQPPPPPSAQTTQALYQHPNMQFIQAAAAAAAGLPSLFHHQSTAMLANNGVTNQLRFVDAQPPSMVDMVPPPPQQQQQQHQPQQQPQQSSQLKPLMSQQLERP